MSDTMLTYLDSYCERAGHAGALAEPLNFLTNGFFIIAALFGVFALLRYPAHGKRWDLWLLVGLMATIGMGSGLWHWHPTDQTLLMDVIPITLFINVYIIATLRRLFGLSWAKVLFWWGLYFVAGLLAQANLPTHMLNGTILYIPTYGVLVLLTIALLRIDHKQGRAFAVALAVWTLSLIFRTMDLELCTQFRIGTHFL